MRGSDLICTERLCAGVLRPMPGELAPLCTALVPAALPGSRQELCWRASAPGRGSLGNQESHTSVGPQVSAELLMPPGKFILLYQLV